MRPFHLIQFWAVGGFALGLFTAMLSRNAIWICTDAVETTVLHHLEWQLAFLDRHDPEAYAAVSSIVADEESHQQFGRNNSGNAQIHKPIFSLVKRSTEFAIWLSTKLS